MNNYLDKLNDIEVNLDGLEIEPLSDIEKKKYKKNVKKSINKKQNKFFAKKYAVVAAMAGVMLMTPLLSEAVHAGIEIVSKSIENLTGEQEGKYADYKDVINQQITEGNYTVKLNEVMFNEDRVYISSTILKNDGDFEDEFGGIQPFEIFINGEKISHSVGTKNNVNGNTNNQLCEFIYDKGVNLSGEANVKIAYGGTSDSQKTEYDIYDEGKWEFNFKADVDKMKQDIKDININNTIKIDDNRSVSMDKVIVSPIGVLIKADIKDDLLNEPDPENLSPISFKVVDDLNNELQLEGTELTNQTEYTGKYMSIDKNASKITITPTIQKDGKVVEMNDKSFTVDLK